MLYGMQCVKDVRLSSVARWLHEVIALIKTENRLSGNLSSEDMADVLNRRLSWLGSGQVKGERVLAVDSSDLTKRYAKKMEYLGRVRDGSEGELSEGYWLCDVLAIDVGGSFGADVWGVVFAVLTGF